MEPSALTKAGSQQEEAQPMWGTDLGPVPNLRRSNSSLCKKRGPQFLFNSSEKASGQWPAARRRVRLSPWHPATTGRGVSCWAETPARGATAQEGSGREDRTGW